MGELAVLRFKPMAVTSVAMSSENICCWNKYLCVTLLHCFVFVFLWGMPSLSKSRISSHPVYLLSWLCYCRAQKEQKGEECGSCGSVIRLVPAFSRGLTSYPGAQFSCVEILTREDVPWSPWVVRSERQPHQCGRPPWRLAAWGPFPVWSPTPLTVHWATIYFAW